MQSLLPSQLIAEKGSTLVVINPGSANVRVGIGSWPKPVSVPHCIAHRLKVPLDEEISRFKRKCEQVYRQPLSKTEEAEREREYEEIATTLMVHPPEHDSERGFCVRKVDYFDERTNPWTNIKEERGLVLHDSDNATVSEADVLATDVANDNHTFRATIYGEEAMRISPDKPYILRHPIRRGHFNISEFYSMQQISEDLYRIWDWILKEKCNLTLENRQKFSAVLVLPETFESREIKEMVSVILRDLQFESVAIYQESFAAIFGNGVASACVVNMGAQVTTISCIEDGVILPGTVKVLPYGGEDISRSLLWVQQHRQAWPPINTDPMSRPIDLLMLDGLKKTHCMIKEGACNALDEICFYEPDPPAEIYKISLSALNIPPMGLFSPSLFIPDEYPPPPRPWLRDYEDTLEDSTHTEFARRPDAADMYFSGSNFGMCTSDFSDYIPFKCRKEENHVGLAEAITNSILSTGRLEAKKKLFSNILLVGGVALTEGLVGTVEERVLNAIPTDEEAIQLVEVLPHKSDPMSSVWRGGVIAAILDTTTREVWIRRDEWIANGIHVGSGRKYRDSTIVQTQALWFINP